MGRPFPLPDALPLTEQQGATYPTLVALMQRLLASDGCPWDREQDYASIRRYVLEEACEVIDAIDTRDFDGLREELGVDHEGGEADQNPGPGAEDVVRDVEEEGAAE